MGDDKRILIVEEDKKFVRELLSLFEDEDYDIEVSWNFTDAVKRIKDIKFDCVLIDAALAQIKGYEAVPVIKTIDPRIHIIMIAGQNSRELEEKIRKQDIFYYYIKSFDRNELKMSVQSVFKKLGKIKEGRDMNRQAKILIVDDDPDFVDTLKLILEKEKYDLASAFNKTEALKKIEEFKPDLILLDIMMETITDGFHVCYKLKGNEQTRGIPILAISAINETSDIKFSPKTDGEYFPADDFIEKPVKPEDLLNRVEKLLS